MPEDPKIARELAQNDLTTALRGFQEHGIPGSITAPETIAEAPLDAQTLIYLMMARGDLTKRNARQTAEAFRHARARSPQSPVCLSFLGYDQDPREVWQFPEVRRFLRWWARFAGIGEWQAAAAVPWLDPSWGVGLLAACGVFGDDRPFVLRLPPRPPVT